MWMVSVDRTHWGDDSTTPSLSAALILLLELGDAVRFFSCNGFIFLLVIKMSVNHL